MKKIFAGICSFFFFISAYSQAGTTVVISQVYSSGGKAGAHFQNDFVELFNPTPATASLNGWSVQYATGTGTTWEVVHLTNFTLQPGQYYLVQLAFGGAVGDTLPAADVSGSINMSNTNGKVALCNTTAALTGCLPDTAIIDLVGYGATCFEGAAAAPAPVDNSFSISRGSNGCQDGNNNVADFTAGTAHPRNSSSPFSTCGVATPLISVFPANLKFGTTLGVTSPVLSYTVSGTTLSPAAGNITITAGAPIEISLTSGGPFGTVLTIPYTNSMLSGTIIYVRAPSTAPLGEINTTVTNAGGGAAVDVHIGGGIFQNFYNTKANLGLNNVGTWSTTRDGSGATPADFTTAWQLFNIIDQANADYTGTWEVSAPDSDLYSARIVVGNGLTPISFTILPGADSLTSATAIDVLNYGTLVLQNNRLPLIHTIAVGSTIDFAEAGNSASDTILIPPRIYYHLKLTGGIKYFSPGGTTVRGNLTIDGVTGVNGANISKIRSKHIR